MELARAYNNLAYHSEPEGRKLLHQALELMQSHEEELGDTYSWNFRMGYAYYYLDHEGRALRHFEKALDLQPGDDPKLNTRQDMEELIDSCKKGISLPQFSECFRERTEDWWETFAEMEAQLRQISGLGLRFCHPSRFLITADDKETAIEACRRTLRAAGRKVSE